MSRTSQLKVSPSSGSQANSFTSVPPNINRCVLNRPGWHPTCVKRALQEPEEQCGLARSATSNHLELYSAKTSRVQIRERTSGPFEKQIGWTHATKLEAPTSSGGCSRSTTVNIATGNEFILKGERVGLPRLFCRSPPTHPSRRRKTYLLV